MGPRGPHAVDIGCGVRHLLGVRIRVGETTALLCGGQGKPLIPHVPDVPWNDILDEILVSQ